MYRFPYLSSASLSLSLYFFPLFIISVFTVQCFVSFTFFVLVLFLFWWGLSQNNKQIYFSPSLNFFAFTFFFYPALDARALLRFAGSLVTLLARKCILYPPVAMIKLEVAHSNLRKERVCTKSGAIGVESNSDGRERGIRSGPSSIAYQNVNRNCHNDWNRYRAHSGRWSRDGGIDLVLKFHADERESGGLRIPEIVGSNGLSSLKRRIRESRDHIEYWTKIN